MLYFVFPWPLYHCLFQCFFVKFKSTLSSWPKDWISLYSIVFLQSACLKVCTAVVWLVCEEPTCTYVGLHRLAVSTDEGCIQGVAVRSAPQGGHFTAVVSQGHSRGGAEAEIFGKSNYTSDNQTHFCKYMLKNRIFLFNVYKVKYLQTLWFSNIYYNANSFNKTSNICCYILLQH